MSSVAVGVMVGGKVRDGVSVCVGVGVIDGVSVGRGVLDGGRVLVALGGSVDVGAMVGV